MLHAAKILHMCTTVTFVVESCLFKAVSPYSNLVCVWHNKIHFDTFTPQWSHGHGYHSKNIQIMSLHKHLLFKNQMKQSNDHLHTSF